MEKTINLGKDKLSKLLLKFAIPCITGLVISALYNIIDQIFIGNSELGYLGNAATGVSFPIICICNAFAWCIGDGAASYLSICAGRNDNKTTHKCIGTGISVSFMISVILSVVCLIFCKPLMVLFGASDQTTQMAVDYFRIIAAFFPVYLLGNVMNSMIRADGAPSYAMIAILSGAILNLILDPIFIFLLKWGITGAAWATVIGQFVSFVLCCIHFFKPKTFKLTLESFIPDASILKKLIQLGGATFVTQISIVIVSMVSNITLSIYGALSIYGPDIPISVFSIQTKVYTIVLNVVVGIVLGAQPIFGYNYGSKQYDRVKKLYKMVLISTICVGLVATLIFQVCPQVVINLFGAQDELYMEFAKKVFRIYLSLMVVTALVKMTAVFFQSIGKSVNAVLASVVRDVCCFSVLAIILTKVLESNKSGSGIYGVLYAAPIADIIALIMVIVLTIPFFKKLDKQIVKQDAEVSTTTITPSKPGVVICISRQHGTQGKQIGKRIAEKLNIPFYSKEVASLMVKESGLDESFVSNLNENDNKLVYNLYLSKNVCSQAITAQENVIKQIAANGSCVIVGRAADHFLKECPNVFRVFIYAPIDYRVNNIMMMYNDSLEDAQKYIKKSDATRARYYEDVTGKTWGLCENYDLCINSSTGVEMCADDIIACIAKYNK